MNIPEVRIYFSWLLYDNVSSHLHNQLSGADEQLASKDKCWEWAENYKNAWAPYNDRILHGLTDALGLEFYKPVIDVPVAPWIRSIYSPLVMSFKSRPNQFVDGLTHELCHELLTDNKSYQLLGDPNGAIEHKWRDIFGDQHSFSTLVHIPVHALCKHIYLDVLQEPMRLDRDKNTVQHFPDYKLAWDYVDNNDYREIIQKLKDSYKDEEIIA